VYLYVAVLDITHWISKWRGSPGSPLTLTPDCLRSFRPILWTLFRPSPPQLPSWAHPDDDHYNWLNIPLRQGLSSTSAQWSRWPWHESKLISKMQFKWALLPKGLEREPWPWKDNQEIHPVHHDLILFLFFCDTSVWIQGFTPYRQVLYCLGHSTSSFALLFWTWGLDFCPGPFGLYILLFYNLPHHWDDR
jgi:hypothetical protein